LAVHGSGGAGRSRGPLLRAALAALAAAAIAGAGAPVASAVVTQIESGATVSYLPAPGSPTASFGTRPFDAFFKNLDYNGGPVMPSNANYAFYWSPVGTSAYPASFTSGVDRYFEDLAHDSGGVQNVDSVATQYNDAEGQAAQYNSTFGGQIVDTNPYPANGCTRAPKCLTDAQIRTELAKYIGEHGLPADLKHEYFVLTPSGVESCFEPAGFACSANASEHQAYCAYHGNIPLEGGGEIIYSNDPFVNGKNCDEPTHHINGTSDSALFGGLSHEHNESTTDPEPNNAWTDFGGSGETTGYENGDKCRTFEASSEFGTPLGEVLVGGKNLTYNQEINGDKYWYQQEWSNKGHTCLQRLNFKPSEWPTATFSSAPVSGNEVKFDATGSTAGAGVRYSWQFNDASGEPKTVETPSLTLNHKFPSASTFTVALTVLKSEGTSRGTARPVTPGKKSQDVTFTSTAPGSATVAGSTYEATAEATSKLAVTLTIDAASSEVCSISGSTVHFIGAGTCTIDGDQAGSGEYDAAPQARQSFTVSRKTQTITYDSPLPSTPTVGGTPYTVAAKASSTLTVGFTIDATSAAVCSISGTTVSFIGEGTCKIDANQAGNAEYSPAPQAQMSFSVSRKPQTVTIDSEPAPSPSAFGPMYNVVAKSSSGLPVALTIDATATSVCSISGTTVSFLAEGTCKVDVNQAGNAEYSPATPAQQSFSVGPDARPSQSITFTTIAPAVATVGTTYVVAAEATSKLPVALTIDGPSASVCTISGSTVTFAAAGSCVIDANQPGNAQSKAAPQVQQAVNAIPVVVVPPLQGNLPGGPLLTPPEPDSTFTAGARSFDTKAGQVTFIETIKNAGTFRWLLTFPNGKFGVFASSVKCKAGYLRLAGRCRPSKVVFAKGVATVPAGIVVFKLKPTTSALRALKAALKRKTGVPVAATFTFQSSLGGAPVSHTQTINVKLKKR
jgi:hypothetical protein